MGFGPTGLDWIHELMDYIRLGKMDPCPTLYHISDLSEYLLHSEYFWFSVWYAQEKYYSLCLCIYT